MRLMVCYRVGVGGADGGPSDQLLTATRVVHERKVRREIANSNERKRMQSINAGFQSLRLLLPRNGPVDRLSKVSQSAASLAISLLPSLVRGKVTFPGN